MRTITTLLTALLVLLMLAAPLAAAQEDSEAATTQEEPQVRDEGNVSGDECPPEQTCATSHQGEPMPYGAEDCPHCSGSVDDAEPKRSDPNCMDGSADDCNWDYRYLTGNDAGTPEDKGATDDDDGRVYKGDAETAGKSTKTVPAVGILLGSLGLMAAALLVARRR